MRQNYAKWINAAGLLLLTVQYLVVLFDYVVSEIDFGRFLVTYWAAMCGLVLLVALFIRKLSHGTDFILTVIGIMLWVVQIADIFKSFPDDPIQAFLVCSTGIFGVMLTALGLFFDIKAERKNKQESDK